MIRVIAGSSTAVRSAVEKEPKTIATARWCCGVTTRAQVSTTDQYMVDPIHASDQRKLRSRRSSSLIIEKPGIGWRVAAVMESRSNSEAISNGLESVACYRVHTVRQCMHARDSRNRRHGIKSLPKARNGWSSAVSGDPGRDRRRKAECSFLANLAGEDEYQLEDQGWMERQCNTKE